MVHGEYQQILWQHVDFEEFPGCKYMICIERISFREFRLGLLLILVKVNWGTCSGCFFTYLLLKL